jgi:hypothetical protein
MTSGVDRATLPLMGRMPDENILSIDDGVPYYPGTTALAESPRRRGVLYVGTDDGQFGSRWTTARHSRASRRASLDCRHRRGFRASRHRGTPTARCM